MSWRPARARRSFRCSAERRCFTANAPKSRRSCCRPDSVPLHQLVERRAQVRAAALEVRMHRERTPERFCGPLIFTQREVAEALTRERAEMVRIARERLA